MACYKSSMGRRFQTFAGLASFEAVSCFACWAERCAVLPWHERRKASLACEGILLLHDAEGEMRAK